MCIHLHGGHRFRSHVLQWYAVSSWHREHCLTLTLELMFKDAILWEIKPWKFTSLQFIYPWNNKIFTSNFGTLLMWFKYTLPSRQRNLLFTVPYTTSTIDNDTNTTVYKGIQDFNFFFLSWILRYLKDKQGSSDPQHSYLIFLFRVLLR